MVKLIDDVHQLIEVIKEHALSKISVSNKETSNHNHHTWDNSLVKPKENESLFSWIMRQSFVFDLSPLKLIKSEIDYWEIENPSLVSKKLNSTSINEYLSYCNIQTDHTWFQQFISRRGSINFSTLLFQLPHWVIKDADVHLNRYFYQPELSFCPKCWMNDEQPYFRLKWHNPLYVICEHHNTELINKCGSCESYLFSKRKQKKKWKYSTIDDPSWLDQCWNCQISIINPFLSNDRTDQELGLIQSQVISNANMGRFLEKLSNPNVLFGINWDEQPIIMKYLRGILSKLYIKRREIENNPIAFELFKFEILLQLENSNTKLRDDIDPNLKLGEFDCFIPGCIYRATNSNGKGHLTRGRYKRHLAEVHLDQERATKNRCSSCNISFDTRSEHITHYNKNHRDWYCKECSINFESEEEYNQHMYNHPQECSICKNEFEKGSERQNHYNNIHRKWRCSFCDIPFPDVTSHKSHYDKLHRQWRCSNCDIDFLGKKEYRKHYYENHPKCKKCDFTFETRSEYRRHYNDLHNEWNCGRCKIKLGSRAKYKKHYRSFHRGTE